MLRFEVNQDRDTQVYSPEMDAGPRHLGVLQRQACESRPRDRYIYEFFVYVLRCAVSCLFV